MTPRLDVFSAADVARLMRPADWLHAAREGLIAAAVEPSSIEPRRLAATDGEGGVLASMVGRLAGGDGYGAKVVSVSERPKALGLQPHQGAVLLFDEATGCLRAVADGGAVTLWRTAWASAAATDRLARPDAHRLGIAGTGAQAVAHACAIAHVRALSRVVVWGRDPGRAAAAARAIQDAAGVEARAEAHLPTLLAQGDIVCTATAARAPLFADADVRDGTHVNAVGASVRGFQELPAALLLRARVFIDHEASAFAQADDLREAWPEGSLGRRPALIGDALRTALEPDAGARGVTVFRSVGVVTQDLAAVARCVRRAEEEARRGADGPDSSASG